jgi:hypothetical protein
MGVRESLISVLGWKIPFDNLSNAMDHYQALYDIDTEDDCAEEGTSTPVVKCALMEEVIYIHTNRHGDWPDLRDTLLTIDGFEFRCRIETGSYSHGNVYVYFGVHYTEYSQTKSKIPMSDILKFNSLNCEKWIDVVNFIKMIQGSYEEPAVHSLSYVS